MINVAEHGFNMLLDEIELILLQNTPCILIIMQLSVMLTTVAK